MTRCTFAVTLQQIMDFDESCRRWLFRKAEDSVATDDCLIVVVTNFGAYPIPPLAEALVLLFHHPRKLHLKSHDETRNDPKGERHPKWQ